MVDPNDKQAMADILAHINDDPFAIGESQPAMQIDETSNAVATRVPVLDDAGQAMKDILLCLQPAMDEQAGRLVDESTDYPKLKAALVTERTTRGARVGSWEIVKHAGDDFDVVNVATGEPIARSLRLYEAACALATGLNAGKTLTDAPIRRILALEERYAQHHDKASHFKQMARKLNGTGESTRAAIAEDRFDDARDKAIEERDQLLKLAGLL